jgi:hypothetical protein
MPDTGAGGGVAEAGNPLAFERSRSLAAYLHRKGYRSRELWEAMHLLNELTTLSSVPRDYRAKLIHAKDLTTLITVIIDDLADDVRDRQVLLEMARLLQRVDDEIPAYPEGDERIEMAVLAWRTVVSILRQAPRYEEFRDLWLFDMAELVQCQRYNFIINEMPSLANTEEYLVYGTHNFNVKPHMTMDLMFSPGFREEDLGVFREALQHIQVAVQLVNDLFTLEREVLREGSIASYPIIWMMGARRAGESDAEGHRIHLEPGCASLMRLKVRTHMERAAELLQDVSSFEAAAFLQALRMVEEVYRRSKGRI